jgi:putative SOS response-associated peptidase YedK
MCGRYSFVPSDNANTRFKVGAVKMWLEPHYNVAPGSIMPVITRDRKYNVEMMKWGLVPHWSKDPRRGVINARSETAAVKPFFRRAFRTQRWACPDSVEEKE